MIGYHIVALVALLLAQDICKKHIFFSTLYLAQLFSRADSPLVVVSILYPIGAYPVHTSLLAPIHGGALRPNASRRYLC